MPIAEKNSFQIGFPSKKGFLKNGTKTLKATKENKTFTIETNLTKYNRVSLVLHF